MDIRVGKVLAAERVPETDKLIKCTVDFGPGAGERTIVSGIALFRSPESLVGKYAVYIINLAPRIIRNIESQGMLLALGGVDTPFSLLVPDTEVPPGAKVK